jgi:hypothetical protein
MLDIASLAKIAVDTFPYQIGAFYGASAGLELGVGLVVSGVTFPLFDEDEQLYDTAKGLVYVLTHECDLANERALNDYVLVCPIISFDAFVKEYADRISAAELGNLVPDLAANKIYRALYVPLSAITSFPMGVSSI